MSPAPTSRLGRAARAPALFLVALAFTNQIGFAAWQALINNFAREEAGFTGWEIGVLQSVREVPRLLAFTAIFWFMLMREQTLAYLSLLLLGVGVALTGLSPTIPGLLVTTSIMSVGFHYFETANQSLQLQLLPKAEAPLVLGQVASAAALAQLTAYGAIALLWSTWRPGYPTMFALAGGAALVLALAAILAFPRFEGTVPQRKGFVLRRRYGLYYALTFMSGARRQLFMAFGAFLLVERFGFGVEGLAQLLFLTCGLNIVAAPLLGRLIARAGERATIVLENLVLVAVFVGYATTASGAVAGALFVVDGVFFLLTLAQRTYLQKIADPADIAPTSSVAFTINHIAAVAIPVTFGLIWVRDPSIVFEIGAGVALGSLGLAFLVPRHPEPGRETVFAAAPRAAPAE